MRRPRADATEVDTMPKLARLTTADFDLEILNLFDQYVHGLMDRRAFLSAAGRMVGVAAAAGVLGALMPQFAAAQQVKPDDRYVVEVGESGDS